MSNRAKHWAAVVSMLAGLVVVVLIAGCAGDAEEAVEVTASQSTEPWLSLRVTDADGYRQTLDKHRGKVVLVDFWATWCAPCVEQFPHTVALERKYRDRGLAVIGVSLDSLAAEPQVREFLDRHEARFDNLLSSYRSPVEATKAFGLPGPVPCYRVYDRAGKLRHEFSVDPRAARQFTTADIEAAIEELL